MNTKESILDKSQSVLILQGTEEEQKSYSKKIDEFIDETRGDVADRIQLYQKRKDFYEGNQGQYSNIFGIVKDTKQKKGHTNQVTNYAGKSTVKIAYGLANNPPKITIPGLDESDTREAIRAQSVETFIDRVLDSKRNRFWKKTYRRACFNQAEFGEAAILTFVVGKEIRIVGHDNLGTVHVGWNNADPFEFDCVATENYMTPRAIFDMFGVMINDKQLKSAQARMEKNKKNSSSGSWTAGQSNVWATKGGATGASDFATGRTNLLTFKVVSYDSADIYAIKIEDELVQLIIKDDVKFPKIKLWTLVHNIPNPPSPWSIADIDYMISPQVELNDNDNRTSDYIRVGGVQRYVAYNLEGFDADSIKTHSGQVIMVNSPDGTGRFEPLQTNINNFPADQYHSRKLSQLYDMGLPKVNYGASGADSGRSKAIDYQSSIDITIFKRDAWELALLDIMEKIQILGWYLYELDFFKDTDGNFITRDAEFDWTDILPTSSSEKIVNVANKVNMVGIPLRQAFKELGYRNVDQLIAQLKAELKDPELMTLRAKMFELSQGILTAQANAQMQMADQPPPVATNPNQAAPTLSPEQNTGASMPMAAKGGTAVSTPSGMIAKARQNQSAQGR